MNDEFRCPDCGTLHTDPAEAVLGTNALCWDCELVADTIIEPALRPAA